MLIPAGRVVGGGGVECLARRIQFTGILIALFPEMRLHLDALRRYGQGPRI